MPICSSPAIPDRPRTLGVRYIFNFELFNLMETLSPARLRDAYMKVVAVPGRRSSGFPPYKSYGVGSVLLECHEMLVSLTLSGVCRLLVLVL